MFSGLVWDLILYLDSNLESFKGLSKSIVDKLKSWQEYYSSPDPRKEIIPDGWNDKLSNF